MTPISGLEFITGWFWVMLSLGPILAAILGVAVGSLDRPMDKTWSPVLEAGKDQPATSRAA